MTLWTVDSPAQEGIIRALFPPVEVLFEFNGPLIFTFKNSAGNLFLAYQVEEDSESDKIRYFVAPTSSSIVEDLNRGTISIRSALTQPISWLVDTDQSRLALSVWSSATSDLPDDAIPEPHVMLRPELQPLIRVRAIGESIKRGSVPGESIKQIVSGVESAIKTITDYILDRSSTGRPPEDLRRLWALTAQGFAYASFEISFREPKASDQVPLNFNGDSSGGLAKVNELLLGGLKWAASSGVEDTASLGATVVERKVVLEAIRHLTPTARGHASEIEIGGKLISPRRHQSIRLTRESRKKVDRGLKTLRDTEEVVFDQRGMIREIDLDNFTFILREMSSPGEQKCSFEADVADEVLEALNSNRQVRVTGRRSPSSSIVNVAFITE